MSDGPDAVRPPPQSLVDARSLGDGVIDVRRQRRSVLDVLDLLLNASGAGWERGWDVVFEPRRGRTRVLGSFPNEGTARGYAGQLDAERRAFRAPPPDHPDS